MEKAGFCNILRNSEGSKLKISENVKVYVEIKQAKIFASSLSKWRM
jgi:hypothetical protein